MEKLTEGIDIEDELNLYLVANGLKPASLVTLDLLEFEEEYNIRRQGDKVFIYEESDIKIKPEHIIQFQEFLDKLGVAYHQNETENWQTYNKNGKPIQSERILFQIGKNKESLDKLLCAETDEEIGLALGFPVEAIRAYDKVIDDERRDGQYVQVALAKAKQAGLELPTWLAYISHVPKGLDLVNGNISETSKALGEKYQDFVRTNNPELARRIEQYFLDRRFPDAWEKTLDGSYVTIFSHPQKP